jgi:dolichol-phosphate mannosyltransferase
MITVIVPVLNEAENIRPLVKEILAIRDKVPLTEILYVDDGSDDATPDILAELTREQPLLRYIRTPKRSGQSAATWLGAYYAQGGLIVTLDGDGQNDPADIVPLYRAWKDEQQRKPGPVMVAGQRAKRNDSWLRRVSSRIANKVRANMLKDGVRDTGCALKLMPRDEFLRLPRFNHMHRFLAALLRRDGVRVLLVDVSHRPRTAGQSKYGLWNRLWVGIVDLFGVAWLQARAMPPLDPANMPVAAPIEHPAVANMEHVI